MFTYLYMLSKIWNNVNRFIVDRFELIVFGMLLYVVFVIHTVAGCCNKGVLETMTTVADHIRDKVSDKRTQDTKSNDVSQSDANGPPNSSTEGFSPFPGTYYKPGFFDGTPFTFDCCPNTYTSSSGCACMDKSQYNTLKGRFGNNVPFSEY
jgi:hypothetical protein